MSIRFKLRKILGNRDFLDYNPQKFWSERHDGRSTGREEWLKDLVKFLKKHKCKSLIEVGCGNGCNLGYVKKAIPEMYCWGFDLSKEQIWQAEKSYPNVDFDVMKIKEWTSANLSFDCVLTSGVLMHVPPKDIKEAVKKIKQSAPLVYCYEPVGSSLRHSNNFVFFHNYSELFSEMCTEWYIPYAGGNVARGFVWTT
jgi:SAM-dependent methyltransferase